MDLNFLQQNIWILLTVVVWEVFWKGYALWFSARRNQKYWFITLLIVNSIGILSVIYLLMYKNKKYET